MRTIKFRGKSSVGLWFYGGYYYDKELDEHRIIIDSLDSSTLCESVIVKPETVGQFTCVIDKSGKEVYEGDVIICREFSNTSGMEMTDMERELFSLEELKGEKEEENVMLVTADGVSLIAETEFGPDGSSGTWMDVMDDDQRHSFPIHEVEVLGNIHDNPQLFKIESL